MDVNFTSYAATEAMQNHSAASKPPGAPKVPSADNEETRETFHSFVGQALFGQLLKAMRKTVGKSAYFDGGRAEEIFQGQLDQVLAEKLSQASSARLSEPMYELFSAGLARR